MSAVRFRAAAPADEAAIRRIVEAAFDEFTSVIGRRPSPMGDDFGARISAGDLFVGEADGEIVAALTAWTRDDHLHVYSVAVAPERRGRGYGEAAMAHAEAVARTRGLAAIELFTNALMAANLRWYPRLGYQLVDRRREDGYDRVYFRKPLGAG